MEAASSLDARIWKVCAGRFAQVPEVGSWVYYFPQGHAEQSWTRPEFSALVTSKPVVPCGVLAVEFLACRKNDEVFARIRLAPINASRGEVDPRFPAISAVGGGDGGGGDNIVSFMKVLTPSDSNNGGGFSVPRGCADSVFPPLNLNDDPPVQTLSIKDVHGVSWEFRHIYRGTPRRHLLTTGWSKFVDSKKLIAGDTVVFMRNRGGELFVGIRRTDPGIGDSAMWSFAAENVAKMEGESDGKESTSWRRGRGRVSAKSVEEAAELAVSGRSFDVLYYPKVGWSSFIVKAEKVDEAMRIGWMAGMKVKMAMETADSHKMTWFQGTVSGSAFPGEGPWGGSPWRMLQVAWEESDVLKSAKRVSPWEVQLVIDIPRSHLSFYAPKELTFPQFLGSRNGGDGQLISGVAGLTVSTMGEHMRPLLYHGNNFPSGMQGARHYPTCSSDVSNLIANFTQSMFPDHTFGSTSQEPDSMSTELASGSTSQPENSSLLSQHSVHSFGMETKENPVFGPSDASNEAGVNSIRLFGKIIHIQQSVESDI